jgi:hypothetical protein
MAAERDRRTVDCTKCKHFYVTWDRNHPKGCKVMGFKGVGMPSTTVYKSSGIECLRFEAKKKGNR